MAVNKERISDPNTDENWKIANMEMIPNNEKDMTKRKKELTKAGHADVADNLLELLGAKNENGIQTFAVENNTVGRNAKGEIVERKDKKGKILTSVERENVR